MCRLQIFVNFAPFFTLLHISSFKGSSTKLMSGGAHPLLYASTNTMASVPMLGYA